MGSWTSHIFRRIEVDLGLESCFERVGYTQFSAMDCPFKICDGRCGHPYRHVRYECPKKHCWEMSEVSSERTLPWVFKMCTECVRYTTHVIDECGNLFICCECHLEETVARYSFVDLKCGGNICRKLVSINKIDSNIRAKVLNGVGNVAIRDTCLPPADAIQERVYKLGRYQVPESRFRDLFYIPGDMEKLAEKQNLGDMMNEDLRGNIKYSDLPDFSPKVATLHRSDLHDPWKDMLVRFTDERWLRLLAPNGHQLIECAHLFGNCAPSRYRRMCKYTTPKKRRKLEYSDTSSDDNG